MTAVTQPRLKARYNNTIKQQLAKDLGINNDMQIPKLEKIVINMGVGRATATALAAGEGGRRPHADRRPEADHHARRHVDRRLQAP